MIINFSRIINFAVKDFSRNKGVSLSAVFVLLVMVILASSMLFFWGMADYLITQIQDKIDITAYFKDNIQEKDIVIIKDEIVKIASIKGVEYISKDQALQNFTEKYGNNEIFQKALLEVGGNPFLPSLNIKTDGNPEQFQEVSNILAQEKFTDLIEKVDFAEKKDIINRVFSIRSSVTKAGLFLGIILIAIAIFVVFSTIKLTVNAEKEEITTMRIVGANNWFIQGPFIIQGIIYGFLASIICFALCMIASHLLSNKIAVMLPGFDLFNYFLSNMWIFALVQVGFGIGVGAISSFLAVQKHLK